MAYTDDHRELRSSVRGLLSRSADSAAVRATIAAGGHDTALWLRMTDELGLAGLAVAEEHGGSGFGVVELAVVLEEIGRATLPSPFLSTVLAASALQAAGPPPEVGDVLAALAAGRELAAVHLDGPGGPRCRPDGGRVTGVLPHVPDGTAADHLLLVSADGGALVDLRGPGVVRTALTTMDLTRAQARIELTDAPTRALGTDAAWAARTGALAAVLVACEQVGGAERVLEDATAHALARVQFGRPVGSFQAVKHLLADMLVELELARTVQTHALALAATPDVDPHALDAAARGARVSCSRAFDRLTADAIRVLGGIGYTWDHDAHLSFRRARASAVLFGSVAHDLDRLAVAAGLPAPTVEEDR